MSDIGEMLDTEVRKNDERQEMLMWLASLKKAAVVIGCILAFILLVGGFFYSLGHSEMPLGSYRYIDNMVAEHPSIQPEVAKFLDDGKITRAEYGKIRQLHKRAIVEHMIKDTQ